MNTHEQTEQFVPASINISTARKIHAELAKGCVINKEVYNVGTSQLVDNPLFTTLFKHYNYFKQTYALLGWDLVFRDAGNFFHVSRITDADLDDADNSSIKVCIPLFVIAEHIVRLGQETAVLWNDNLGVTQKDLDQIGANDNSVHLLEASSHKTVVDAIKHLKARNLVFENSKGNIVFSSAAKYFVEQLIEKFAR